MLIKLRLCKSALQQYHVSKPRMHNRLLHKEALDERIPSNLPLTAYGSLFYVGKWTTFLKMVKASSLAACVMTLYKQFSIDIGDPNNSKTPLVKCSLDLSGTVDKCVVVLPLILSYTFRRYITHMHFNYYTDTITAFKFLRRKPLVFKREAVRKSDSSSAVFASCVINGKTSLFAATMQYTQENIIKVLRTSLLVAAWFCMGMRLSVHFATLPDQRDRLGTTTDKLTYTLAIGIIGSFMSPPLAALSDRFQKHADLYFSGLLALYGLMTALKPTILQLWLYAIMEVLESIVMAVISPVGYSLILAMWGKNSQPAVQVFGLGWSVGGIFGPLIAVPFVSVEDENTTNAVNTTEETPAAWNPFSLETYATTSSRNDRYPDDSRIEVAFWIISLCYFVVSALFVVVYLVFKPQAIGKRKKYSWKEILYPAKWAGGDAKLGIRVLVLYILAFICYTGTYNGPSTFLATYAVDNEALGFDNQEAALLTSAYNFAGSCGRVIVIFTAKYISVTKTLAILTHGTVITGVLLAFVGPQSKTSLWVTSCLFPLFYRPIWGSLYTWANNYITLLAALISCQSVVNALATMFILSLQGYLYEATVYESIFYTTVVYASLLCVVYYFMFWLGHGRPTRHELLKQTPDVFVVPSDDNFPKSDADADKNGNIPNSVVSEEKPKLSSKTEFSSL